MCARLMILLVKSRALRAALASSYFTRPPHCVRGMETVFIIKGVRGMAACIQSAMWRGWLTFR
jgi:hypothetical protein